MATKKKTACKDKRKRVTSATVKADLKAKGYRLPHGYDVVKREAPNKAKPKKKTAPKKKTVAKKSKPGKQMKMKFK